MCWLILLLLTNQSIHGVEISSARAAVNEASVEIVDLEVFKTATTLPQQEQLAGASAVSKHEVLSRRRRSTPATVLSANTEASVSTNSSKKHVRTDKESEFDALASYVGMITDGIVKKIKGLPVPDLKSLENSQFLCSVTTQFEPVWYNPKVYICCEGLHNRSSDDDICCDKQVVSSRDVFCCDNKIYNKSETNHTTCCGDSLYNPDEEICCGLRLHPRTENSSCCASAVYDMRTQQCCYGLTVHERSHGDRCCGLTVYHSATHTCCFGNVQPAYGRKNNRGECCGENSYDARCFSCEPIRKITVPLFDINAKICCGGKIRRRHWDITQCCGRRTMDGQTQMCANNTVMPLVIITTLRSIFSNRLNSENVSLPTSKLSGVPTRNVSRVLITKAYRHETEISTTTMYAAIFCSIGLVVLGVSVGAICYSCRRARKSMFISTSAILLSRSQTEHLIANINPVQQNSANTTSIHTSKDNRVSSKDLHRSASKSSLKSRISISLPLEISLASDDDFEDIETNDPALTLLYKNTDLSKNLTSVAYQNICENLVSNAATQTTVLAKPCNLFNTFGRRFDHSYVIDAKNPTVAMPESDEKMRLPEELLADSAVETHCSSYWDIGEITQKFAIPENESIASPVAEYLLTGHRELPGYAVVVKPFLGSPDLLKVYKFKSDHGANPTSELVPVPRREKLNEEMDMFYVTDGNLCYIYTKSFSGFLCTTCKHSRNLRLTAFLYGSYKSFPQGPSAHKYEARLKLYIADELLQIRDFQQGMENQESDAKRSRVAQQQLELNDVTTADDDVEMSMVLRSEGWAPVRHPTKGRPICSPVETIKLREIAEQCQDCPNQHTERTLPYSKEWYLVNEPGRVPNPVFQCLVEITCVPASAAEGEPSQGPAAGKENTIIVDELALPGSLRHDINNDDRKLDEIRDFLTTVQGENRQALLEIIRKRQNAIGNSLGDLLDCLRRKFRFEGVMEELWIALEACHMDHEIKHLQTRGLLPDQCLTRPQQRVQSHVDKAACYKPAEHFEGMSLPPAINRGGHDVDTIYTRRQLEANRSWSENNVCRREITPTMTSSLSGPQGMAGQAETRSLQGRGVQPGSCDVPLHVPVQEHASMDETKPLKIAKSSETV